MSRKQTLKYISATSFAAFHGNCKLPVDFLSLLLTCLEHPTCPSCGNQNVSWNSRLTLELGFFEWSRSFSLSAVVYSKIYDKCTQKPEAPLYSVVLWIKFWLSSRGVLGRVQILYFIKVRLSFPKRLLFICKKVCKLYI